jgi:hypothetical protein
LVPNVAPIQLAIRLLIPHGSLLLGLPDVRALVGPFDAVAACYPWRHRNPDVDRLQRDLEELAARAAREDTPRPEVFAAIADRAAVGGGRRHRTKPTHALATVPYLTEPWYC